MPLTLSSLHLSFTDAFFETMSGLTTTGSTVLVGLDHMAPGILLWRSLLQWIGGIGIVVMAIVLLPAMRIGGMQLFRTEFLGHLRQDGAAHLPARGDSRPWSISACRSSARSPTASRG